MNLKILLVDDNEAIRNMICGQLRSWGYELDVAANGLEALEKLMQLAGSENRPNIVLADWHMPESTALLCASGSKAARHIRPVRTSMFFS